MILERETFKKFGYWPKDLSNASERIILRKCEDCGQIKPIAKAYAGKRCAYCAARITGLNRRAKLTKHNYDPPTTLELTSFFESGNFSYGRNNLLGGGVIRGYGGEIKRRLSSVHMLSMVKMLGIKTNEKKLSKPFLKSRIIEFLRKQDNVQEILDYYVGEHRTLSKTSHGKLWILSDKGGIIKALFDELGYKWRPEAMGQSGRKNARIVVEYASMYLDGRWVHIG